jgi:hypothetical protein
MQEKERAQFYRERSQPKDPQTEIHYDEPLLARPHFDGRGKQIDIYHQYVIEENGKAKWWNTYESIESWQQRVREAHERDDPAYRDVSEDNIPLVIAHSYRENSSKEGILYHYLPAPDKPAHVGIQEANARAQEYARQRREEQTFDFHQKRVDQQAPRNEASQGKQDPYGSEYRYSHQEPQSSDEPETEIHYDSTPVSRPHFGKDGIPIDVCHLHMSRENGRLRWWIEYESITSWQERVREAHERSDPRYRKVLEDYIPSTVAHSYREGNGDEMISHHYPPETGQEHYTRIRRQEAYANRQTSAERPSGERTFEHRRSTNKEQASHDQARQGEREQRTHTNKTEQEQARTSYEYRSSHQEAPKTTKEEQSKEEPPRMPRTRQGERYRQDLPTQEQMELTRLELRLRAHLEEIRARGETINEAEYVREQLVREAKKANDAEQQAIFQSTLASFDAIAYGRYSPKIQEDALEVISQAYYRRSKDIKLHLCHRGKGVFAISVGHYVPPMSAGLVSVFAGALDLPYEYGRPYGSEQGPSIIASHEAYKALNEKYPDRRKPGLHKAEEEKELSRRMDQWRARRQAGRRDQ